MRRIALLSCIPCLALLVCSCQKENNSAAKKKLLSTNSGSIKGDWELRILYGCQTPNCNPYFQPGNGNTWHFTDSTYLHTVKSLSPRYTASDSAVYILGEDTCMATGRMMDYFKAKDDPFEGIFFEITNDTLTLYRGIIPADGTIQKYVRF
jgi:hypothetical protein